MFKFNGRNNFESRFTTVTFVFAGINLGIYLLFITCFLIEPLNRFFDYWEFFRYIAYGSFLISLFSAFRISSATETQKVNLILFYISLSVINLMAVLFEYALNSNWNELGWL